MDSFLLFPLDERGEYDENEYNETLFLNLDNPTAASTWEYSFNSNNTESEFQGFHMPLNSELFPIAIESDASLGQTSADKTPVTKIRKHRYTLAEKLRWVNKLRTFSISEVARQANVARKSIREWKDAFSKKNSDELGIVSLTTKYSFNGNRRLYLANAFEKTSRHYQKNRRLCCYCL